MQPPTKPYRDLSIRELMQIDGFLTCKLCNTTKNLTKHHLKNLDGKKNNRIMILCRDCHNIYEDIYYLFGMLDLPFILDPNEQLQLDYINGLIPFYSINQVENHSYKNNK